VADVSDVLLDLDPILAAESLTRPPPWQDGIYVPNIDLLRRLLTVPVNKGDARKQQSGRVAKAVDAWIAHELRRAGFPSDAVWPRVSRPRVLPADLAAVEDAVALALERLDDVAARTEAWGERAQKKGAKGNPPSFKNARAALASILTTGKNNPFPGYSTANILGRFYVKQIDVAVSSWQHGPDVMISTKTQFSSYLNNKNNRYEEAVGEATNLRDRHPMAAMGFVMVVRTNVYNQDFAFAYLRDLLVRLRRPDGPFDATMLLAADWHDPWDGIQKKEDRDPTAFPTFNDVEDATPLLSSQRFFEDLLRAVTTNTPVDRHTGVRELLPGEPPPGGLPPEEAALIPDPEPGLLDDDD
jgi:hypothetical protein